MLIHAINTIFHFNSHHQFDENKIQNNFKFFRFIFNIFNALERSYL